MNFISKILLAPFALIYALIILIRNYLYSNQYFRAISFDIPVINVGNLSTGGTGKTPHVDYLIRLLKEHYPLGIMSRGYRRKTSGYLEVLAHNKAIEVGDEPLLTKWKHPDITVCVSENRAMGIPSLVADKEDSFVVLLDDAFQHRGIKPGLNILLTPFYDLYVDSNILPLGNLREFKSGADRADIIIVSHSPKDLDELTKKIIIDKLKPKAYQYVFFSSLFYQKMYQVFTNNKESISISEESDIILVTGIANNKSILSHLEDKYNSVFPRKFADHHHFTLQNVESIINTYKNLDSQNKYIVTTEKDLTRLAPFAQNFINANIKVLCLPIKINFVNQDKEKFNKAIFFYIQKTLEEYIES